MTDRPTLAQPAPMPYLTVIEERRPKQKMHTSLGHAKNALTYTAGRAGTLWEWKDGEWSLLHTVTTKQVPHPHFKNMSVWQQTVPWRGEA